MAKISLKNISPGKKYKMIIKAKTSTGDTYSFPAIDFVVPEACVAARSAKGLSIQKVYNPRRLLIAIPEQIMQNLIWKDDVRDVVHIVYRTAGTREDALDNSRFYLIKTTEAISVSSPITMTSINSSNKTDFTNSIWSSGHPRVFQIKLNTKNFYSFQYAVARYTKNSDGTWTGKWLQSSKKLWKILSPQTVWGS